MLSIRCCRVDYRYCPQCVSWSISSITLSSVCPKDWVVRMDVRCRDWVMFVNGWDSLECPLSWALLSLRFNTMMHTLRFRIGGSGHFETFLSVNAPDTVNSHQCNSLLVMECFFEMECFCTICIYTAILDFVWILLNCILLAPIKAMECILSTFVYDDEALMNLKRAQKQLTMTKALLRVIK